MNYNYAIGRAKMEAAFKITAEEYEKAGVSKEWIEYIHELDLQSLNNERKLYRHTTFIDGVRFSDNEDANKSNSPLYKKYSEQLCAPETQISEWGRDSWLEDIDDAGLAMWLKTLKPADIDLLTYQIQDGLLQTDIARLLDVSDAAISKRMKRLRKDLENFSKKG